MKVIFVKDLKDQGKKGEIKEVKDGYAENFLIKNGYVVKYTKTSSSILEANNLNTKLEVEKLTKEANITKEKLSKVIIKFKVKTGSNDKVFGSITTKQIENELTQLGFNVEKKDIIIKNPLSSLGTHKVEINLYKKINGEIQVILEK